MLRLGSIYSIWLTDYLVSVLFSLAAQTNVFMFDSCYLVSMIEHLDSVLISLAA